MSLGIEKERRGARHEGVVGGPVALESVVSEADAEPVAARLRSNGEPRSAS
jgi:hypothetical protein